MTLKQIVQGLLTTALIGVILTVYALDKMDVFSFRDGFTFNVDAFSLKNDKDATYIKEQKNLTINDVENLIFASQSTAIDIIFEDRQDVEGVFEGYYKASKNYKPPTLKVFENGTEKRMELVSPQASFSIGISITSSTDFNLTIKVPMAYKNKLQVTSSSGNLNLPKVDLKTLVLETTSGDINAEAINTEAFQIATSSGTTIVGLINSKQFSVESTSGNISTGDVTSESVKIATASGTIIVGNINSKQLSAESISGDISIGEVTSESVNIETSSGTINVDQASGDVKISSTSGDIQVSKGEAVTKYQVDSSSGTITLDGIVGGSIIETTSGDIEASMVSIEDEISIVSSSGTVTISQAKGLDYELSLKSSSGYIDVSMPVTVNSTNEEHDFSGTVGTGGKNLKIETTSGDINLNE